MATTRRWSNPPPRLPWACQRGPVGRGGCICLPSRRRRFLLCCHRRRSTLPSQTVPRRHRVPASRQNSRESTRARGKRIVEANWGRVEDAEICAEAAFVLASRKDKGGFWGSVGGSFFFSFLFLPKQVLGMGSALSWRSF
jgi:hypothetical protein